MNISCQLQPAKRFYEQGIADFCRYFLLKSNKETVQKSLKLKSKIIKSFQSKTNLSSKEKCQWAVSNERGITLPIIKQISQTSLSSSAYFEKFFHVNYQNRFPFKYENYFNLVISFMILLFIVKKGSRSRVISPSYEK